MLGGGGIATVQAPFSNTRCRQMVSKILIFWKWVLPWLCLISAFQTPTSYKWNDTCPFAFYAVNRVLRFGFWQSEFGFQIVKVPVFRHNNLLQNPTYCKIQPTSPYSKLFIIYCQKYESNIKMLQSLCSQSTCLTKASVSLNVLREDINRKKTFSFGHCPNHLNPPPWPQFGQLGPFFRTSKFKIWKSLED